MFVSARRQKILELLEQHGYLTTKELCTMLGVSPATIRNDLNILGEEHALVRSHGGATALHGADPMDTAPSVQPVTPAVSSMFTDSTLQFQSRMARHEQQKAAIATCALTYVQENQCILLDASTTTLFLAKRLAQSFRQLVVITNGIYHVLTLKDLPSITVAALGGIVTRNAGSIEGTLGTEMLDHFHIDVAFVSAYGFTAHDGLTDFNLYEVELKKQMIRRSKRVIALLDSSKFGSVSTGSLLPPDEIDTILTDPEIDPRYIDECKDLGIDLRICPYPG